MLIFLHKHCDTSLKDVLDVYFGSNTQIVSHVHHLIGRCDSSGIQLKRSLDNNEVRHLVRECYIGLLQEALQ
ncbi:hypothetical protein D3C86_1765810 [compost metagenome]